MKRHLALLLVSGALLRGHAHGDGVAGVFEAKTIPAATVQLIDPESGASSGGGTTDVKVAPGDVILFRFRIFPVPDKIIHGLQGYLTDYIPQNTQVVGVRIIDEDGWTVRPNYPGIATNGCGRPCNRFNTVPSSSGPRNLDDGSISQLYADTGIFYTTDARLAKNPASAFITLANGILMSPEPTNSGSVKSILGTSSPIYAHNAWDWIQVRAYGIGSAASGNNGTGNTPYLYGSPVAGPDTWYRYEASEPVAGSVRFDDVVGPWQRVRYPGSQIGTGAAVNGSGPLMRMNVATNAGFDLKPLSPLPSGTRAVRIALGEIRVGEPRWAEIALRVNATPLDPTMAKDVNCAEVHGGDTSAASDTVRAKDNPWGVYLASPACVFLNLLFDLAVDKPLARTGDAITFTLHGKNLSINPQTSVERRLRYDSTRVTFVSATGGPANLATCDDGSGFSCLKWPTTTLLPSEEYTFTATFTVGGGGHVTNVGFANYRSTQLPAPGFTTQATSMVKEVAVVAASLGAPLAGGVAGGTVTLTGALRNDGSGSGSYDTLTVILPTGWRVTGPLTLGGTTLTCASGCTSNTPTYNVSSSLAAKESRALTFNVLIPAGAPTGLYTVDLQVWASLMGFGGSFETYFPQVATVSVGQGRSDPPGLTCPIGKGDTSISGTTSEADGTVIRVYFNGIERCSTTASGGMWTCTGFVGTFGDLYGGLEVRATADGPTELEGPMSAPCFVTNVPICSDGIDNDGDGLSDFPADPGCDTPVDNAEEDVVPECSDGVDNDGDGKVDWPADESCHGPEDTTESGPPECSDGADNDGDGKVDLADPGCTGPLDSNEAQLRACQDGIDNDGDGKIDFGTGPTNDGGCHAVNDDDEADVSYPAGEVRARLLIAFDTSGSMNWNICNTIFTGGDGSLQCPGADVSCATCSGAGCGNALADDSRLYKVKRGMSDVIAAFGEVEYGLMRFHQRAVAFGCPTQNASLSSGGWQGAGPAPCEGGFAAGDLLVSFHPDNQKELLEWMDGTSNYPGTPPAAMDFELRGSGTTPLAGILGSALDYLDDVRGADAVAGCRPYRVVLVTDGAETCGGDPVAAAGALHAAGMPVHVIGFATGDPTIVANLNAIAAAGGTGSAIVVDDPAALSTAMASIVTETILVEYCNDLDDDCDGLVDEDFPDKGNPCHNGQLGACFRSGVRACRPDQLGTYCTAPSVTPDAEVCNGIDDDCDGLVDEGLICSCGSSEICNGFDDDCDGAVDEGPLPGVGDSCGLAIGACQPGTIQCVGGALACEGAIGPTAEVCNNVDDNCDTVVDGMTEECYQFPIGCTIGVGCVGTCRTGVWTCTAGTWGPTCLGQVGPTAELCNGLDDDCDGMVDEDWPELGMACDNGLVGACRTEGVHACLADGSGTFCTAPPVATSTEVCNGADDDCDGLVDEDPLPPPIGNPCGGGGVCTPGTLQCVGGTVVCVGATGGTPEICNGLDDDCDGLIDEPILPDTGGPCTPPGHEMHGDVGECEFGHLECVGGALVCQDYKGPGPEICNGLDDDCDGVVDDMAECPSPTDLCYEAQCVKPCGPGEFPCPLGFYCKTLPEGKYCVPNPCDAVTCPSGFECQAEACDDNCPTPTANCCCVDRCEGVVCAEGEECRNGFCVDCFDIGCPAGDRCVANSSGVGVCEPDPCYMNSCDPLTQYCDAQTGECKAIDTARCDGVVCPPGRKCDPADGECKSDLCGGVRCDAGQACDPDTGFCEPCTTACPPGFACAIASDDSRTCVAIPPPPGEDILASGGGGCACEVGEAPPAPGRGGLGAALLVAAGLVLVRRRRGAPPE